MNSRYRWNLLALFAIIALGSTSKTWGKSEINTEWNHTRMSIENPNDSVLIVAFGNSITAGRVGAPVVVRAMPRRRGGSSTTRSNRR